MTIETSKNQQRNSSFRFDKIQEHHKFKINMIKDPADEDNKFIRKHQ